jgi:hypothetical protein
MWLFDKLIERWLATISRELIKEAKEASANGKNDVALVLIGIASALLKADGRLV